MKFLSWHHIPSVIESLHTYRFLLGWILTLLSYLITAQFGVYLYRNVGTFPALIWPPVGIALAALIMGGYRMWSAVALASILNGFLNNAPVFLIAGTAFASTIQPIIGVYILKRFQFDALLSSLKDVFLIICVGLCTTCIMPILNLGFTEAYNIIFNASREIPSWNTIWIGGALSALTLTPFITRWMVKGISYRTSPQIIEIGISISLLVLLSTLVFATYSGAVLATAYLLMLIATLFWISFRIGPRFTSAALFLMTAISLIGTVVGEHAPTTASLGQRLINTEIFDLLISIFFFILVSVEEQRKTAIRTLNHDAERLAEALARIRAEDSAKNEFIATLAHELRNPLAPIMSGLELLRIEETDPSRLEVIEGAERQSHIMRRLLDELLDVSRIAHNKYTLLKEEISLQEVLKESEKMVQTFFKSREHSYSHSIPTEPIWLFADSVRLTQIFTNILFNAGKYTKPNGSISLTVTQEPEHVCVAISDSGIGISKAMLSQIFEPFIQVSHHASADSGLGIGLSIAKRLVELHGGSIVAESQGLLKGTTFTVRLPTHQKLPSTTIEEEVENQTLSPLSILIVDDNTDAASSLCKLLKLRGHKIDIAHTGLEALRKTLEHNPQVVLLDIGLPDIDGHEVARRIRQHNHSTKIIGLSGYGTPEDKRKSYAAHFSQHLTKPVGLAEIERVLVAVLS